MVERVLWRDFGSSKDVNGVLSTFFRKKKKAYSLIKNWKKAQHYHFTGFFFFFLSSLSSKTVNNCPNIQSSINHQQHILQIQNTVCLLVFKNATEGQIDPLQWTELLQDRTLHNSLCSKGVISNITQVELWMPLAAALNPSHHPS